MVLVNTDHDRLGLYQEYVKRYGYSQTRVENRDRPGHHWTPRRSCFQDWLISAYVARWRRESYEVGLFLAEDHWLLERGSGVKSGVMFILSDAYHRTGRMEVTFLGPAPGYRATFRTGHEPRIPQSILRLARDLDIPMQEIIPTPSEITGQVASVLPDAVGRRLYARITGFSEDAIRVLSATYGPDLTRACFVVQRGVWSVEQAGYICVHALFPRRLLEGRRYRS